MTLLSILIPQTGSPNATEDPKIQTSLTNLSAWAAGNIDGTNLNLSNLMLTNGVPRFTSRVMSSSNAAAAADFVLASGGVTVTLPAAVANTFVAIACYATNACTVSGSNIYGPGLSAASSFNLALGASVILHADGTNWHMIAGQQDTGWLTITPTAGYNGSTAGAYVASVRVRGDQAMLKGQIASNSTNNVFGTVPVAARPAQGVGFGAIVEGAATPQLAFLTTAGALTSNGPTANGYLMELDGLVYSLT